MNMKLKSYISLFLLLGVLSANAQEVGDTLVAGRSKKAWEIGLGGTVFQFSRVGFSNFNRLDNGYGFDLDLNHAVWGGGIYAARELNSHFYLDLQGNLGWTNKAIEGKTQAAGYGGRRLAMALGRILQVALRRPLPAGRHQLHV